VYMLITEAVRTWNPIHSCTGGARLGLSVAFPELAGFPWYGRADGRWTNLSLQFDSMASDHHSINNGIFTTSG